MKSKKLVGRTEIQMRMNREFFDRIEEARSKEAGDGVPRARAAWIRDIVLEFLRSGEELPAAKIVPGGERIMTKAALDGETLDLIRDKCEEAGANHVSTYVRRCVAWHLERVNG